MKPFVGSTTNSSLAASNVRIVGRSTMMSGTHPDFVPEATLITQGKSMQDGHCRCILVSHRLSWSVFVAE